MNSDGDIWKNGKLNTLINNNKNKNLENLEQKKLE
jgi:hypothetical protein